jgi:hypothetical protein
MAEGERYHRHPKGVGFSHSFIKRLGERCLPLYLYHRFLFLISGKKEYVDVRSRFLFWRERNANRRSDRRRRPSLLSRTARPRAAE